jgi:hypothetical protein
MTRRVRFAIAQPITIVGWYISSLTLIALTSTASGPLQPNSPWVWSQAFWYGIYSAILYLVVASLMLATFIGASGGWFEKDFYLTASQRTLMLQTIMFLMYLLVGALVFSKIEGWSYLDAVYWADVTLFTVGFGDFAASTTLGRALLFPYALVGIVSLGLVIGSIRSLVLERGKHKLDARMVEKSRRKFIKKLHKKGEDCILEPIPTTDSRGQTPTNDLGVTELERRNAEFHLMRKIQAKAAKRRRWMALFVSTSTTVTLWLVGAKVFFEAEKDYQDLDYFDGVYFCFVSLTTIGYGDVTPITNAGKSFFVFWSLLALPTMTVLISNAGDTIVKSIREATDKIGTVTILPGEGGIRTEIKRLLRQFPGGPLFGDKEEPKESPPGFLGNAQPQDQDSSDDEDRDGTDADDAAVAGNGKTDEEHGPLHDRDHPGGRTTSSYYRSPSRGRTSRSSSQRKSSRDSDNSQSRMDTQSLRSAGHEESTARRSKQGEGRSRPGTRENGKDASPSRDNGGRHIRIQASQPKQSRTPDRRSPTDEASPSEDGQSPASTQLRSANDASGVKSLHSHKRAHKRHKSPQSLQAANFAGALGRTPSMPREDIPPDVPTNKADYHVMLIEEIERVSQHLKSHPPRQYTFKEWAWYLKLLGEDEASSETHRKPRPHQHHKTHHEKSSRGLRRKAGGGEGSSPLGKQAGAASDGSEKTATLENNEKDLKKIDTSASHDEAKNGNEEDDGTQDAGSRSEVKPRDRRPASSGTRLSGDEALPSGDEDDIAVSNDTKVQWSWVGAKSPLMGDKEEAEWILQQLMKKLAQELKQVKSGGLERERSKLGSELPEETDEDSS